MRKTTVNLIIAVMIVTTAFISCNNKGNVKSVENITEEAGKVEEKQPQKTVKYIYGDDGGVYGIFFDDGTCRVYDNELPDERTVAYKEYPTYLYNGIGQKKWKLFNDFGGIEYGWNVINYYRIFSKFQITNIELETDKISDKDIQNISQTCLIFILPENIYEEWAWYQEDRKNDLSAMGVTSSVDAKKRYLSFTLSDGEKIIIDTKKKQNGLDIPSCALVYRKGFIPIMISIAGEDDEGTEIIERYLNCKLGYYGFPPAFKVWNTKVENYKLNY